MTTEEEQELAKNLVAALFNSEKTSPVLEVRIGWSSRYRGASNLTQLNQIIPSVDLNFGNSSWLSLSILNSVLTRYVS